MINIYCDKCNMIKNAQIRVSVNGKEISIKCLECGDTKTLVESSPYKAK